MNLSIIIINWNSAKYVHECIRSIYLHTKDISFEIIVLDNASYDGCGEMLAREFTNVKFIQSTENLGFARGNNLAAAHSSGEVVLFLNPDTEIAGPVFSLLLDSLQSLPRAGVVGPRLLNGDGTIQTSCLQPFPTIANQLLDAELLRRSFPNSPIWGMMPLFDGAGTPRSIDGISGACLMTSKEVFQKVGGFTEDYFMYYEDMDYCLKVRASGWDNYYIPNAVVTHYGGKSSGGDTQSRFSVSMMVESAWKFFRKHRGVHYAELFRLGLAVKAISRLSLLIVACLTPFLGVRRRYVKRALNKWRYVLQWCLATSPSGQERARKPGCR